MNESDTYLDNILEGVAVADAPAPRPKQPPSADQRAEARADSEEGSAPAQDRQVSDAREEAPPVLTGLDALLEGLPPLSAADVPSTQASGPQPGFADDRQSETISDVHAGSVDQIGDRSATSAELDTDVSAQSATLPVAAPHDILGLPGQPDIAASHIELALEVNNLAGTQPATSTTDNSNQSFASIAREIAATVEVNSAASQAAASQADAKNADRSSVYLRTRGHRRRRIQRRTRITVTQVMAIVLLLVVGLAAEYEYVARGHSNSLNATTPTAPSGPAARVPTVAMTPVKGTLFHFATTGSAQSAPFTVTRSFAVAVSARCTPVTKSSSVDVVLKSDGRQAANIFLAVRAAGNHRAASATLRPGTYFVSTHASGICSWSAQGIARP